MKRPWVEEEQSRKRPRRESTAPQPFVYQPFANHPFGVPMQQGILAMWPVNRHRRLQRKNPIVGTFRPAKGKKSGTAFTWAGPKAGSATKTHTTYTAKAYLTSNATTLATGIHTHGALTPTNATRRGTATEMKVKRWIVAKGTPTATNVRPAGWDRFQSLWGFIDKSHKCVWVQGHLLYEHLGGRGNRMENLSPFTTSLNKRHQNQVEQPLLKWVKDAPKHEERTQEPRLEGRARHAEDGARDLGRALQRARAGGRGLRRQGVPDADRLLRPALQAIQHRAARGLEQDPHAAPHAAELRWWLPATSALEHEKREVVPPG
jgi:hypothetical protein